MNAEIDDLRSQLEHYQLPLKYVESSNSNTTGSSAAAAAETAALLSQYKKARDEYLQRKIMHTVVHQAATTFDKESGTFSLPLPVPTRDEQEALEERRSEVLQTVTEKAAAVQLKLLELRAKHSHFQQRRDEFEELILLQQNEHHDDEDEEEEDVTIDEAEMAAQEEKLASLQRRRAALEVQLRAIQQQNMKATKKVETRQAELEGLLDKENNASNLENLVNDPVALQSLTSTNAELQAKLAKVTEIANFYENMRLLKEELSGIRIVSVVQGPSDAGDLIVLTVQLLHKYDVEIVLRMTTGRGKKDFTIQSAAFGSNNTVVTGPALDNDEEEGAVVQLRIPSLDDYVLLAGTMPTGENLRGFLRESLARIRMVEERVLELTVLQQEPGVVTKIGTFHGATQDQEVVCSLNVQQMTTVLRLTPDCPLTDGSVYMDQLVGLGGWDAALVQRIQEAVSATAKYRSPVAILHAVKAEIQRLQEEEGLQLPLTPKMPVRGHEW